MNKYSPKTAQEVESCSDIEGIKEWIYQKGTLNSTIVRAAVAHRVQGQLKTDDDFYAFIAHQALCMLENVSEDYQRHLLSRPAPTVLHITPEGKFINEQ